MYQKLWKNLRRLDQEKLVIVAAVLVAVLLCLWTLKPDPKANHKNSDDAVVGLSIPEGFTVLPLQVSNGESLKSLIDETAVVDLYKKNERMAFLKNLKVFRLHGSELQVFGALVPDEIVGELAQLFETPTLVAVIKPPTEKTTQLRSVKALARSLLQIVDMEEDR
jgi:hypothetical protein